MVGLGRPDGQRPRATAVQALYDTRSWGLGWELASRLQSEESEVLFSIYEVRSQGSWEVLMEPAALGGASTLGSSLQIISQQAGQSEKHHIKEYSLCDVTS